MRALVIAVTGPVGRRLLHAAEAGDGLRQRLVASARCRCAAAASAASVVGAVRPSAAASVIFSLRGVGQPPLFGEAVVVLLAVDVDAIDDGVGAERMLVPDHDVGVLADFERADAAVDPQLLRRD